MTKAQAQNKVAQKHFKTNWVNFLRNIVKPEHCSISQLLEMEDEVLELYAAAKVKKIVLNDGMMPVPSFFAIMNKTGEDTWEQLSIELESYSEAVELLNSACIKIPYPKAIIVGKTKMA